MFELWCVLVCSCVRVARARMFAVGMSTMRPWGGAPTTAAIPFRDFAQESRQVYTVPGYCILYGLLVGRLVGCLVGWLFGRLLGRSVGWVGGRSVGWVVVMLIGWSVCCLFGRSVGCTVGRLGDWLVSRDRAAYRGDGCVLCVRDLCGLCTVLSGQPGNR